VEDTGRVRTSIVVYILLTFALSSISYYLVYRHPANNGGIYILTLMWSPGVAGLLTRFAFQKNLSGHGWGWGATKYQFASYWIPIVYAAVVYVPLWIAGYSDFHGPAMQQFYAKIPAGRMSENAAVVVYVVILATLGVVGSCISALGEELGWRGFLVPQLAKVTSFGRVSLISGIVWALWHYPIMLMGLYKGENPLWYSMACFTVMVLGMSFLFAWLRLKSGSVWTGMLLHASHNLFIQGIYDPFTRHARLTNYATGEFGFGLALVAIVLAVIFYGKRGELPQAS
jgi:membrane protease YdiL (CAAX protease family)